jgi:hypothetical protein
MGCESIGEYRGQSSTASEHFEEANELGRHELHQLYRIARIAIEVQGSSNFELASKIKIHVNLRNSRNSRRAATSLR